MKPHSGTVAPCDGAVSSSLSRLRAEAVTPMQNHHLHFFCHLIVPNGLFVYICLVNKKHDHNEVLRSGLKLICSKGYNSLGVDEMCKSTGMTKGAFYNAFQSKENFLLKALSVYGELTVKRLKTQLSGENGKPKAIDRIIGLYDFMFDAQLNNNFMGCLVNNMMSELGSTNEAVGRAALLEFNSFVEAIEPSVKEAQADGDLTLSIDAKTLTELLHSTFYGSLTIAKSTQDHRQGKLIMQTLINTLRK